MPAGCGFDRGVALGPIVSLAVAVAEAPGACACLLGSGVSVDAGIPTGWAVYQDGLRRLYRLENKTEESPDDDGLGDWLASTGRSSLGYSSLLDLTAPDPAIRRSLLAGYFENIDPGPMHISYGSPSSPPRARSACSSRPTSVGCSSARCKRTASKPWSSPTTRR